MTKQQTNKGAKAPAAKSRAKSPAAEALAPEAPAAEASPVNTAAAPSPAAPAQAFAPELLAEDAALTHAYAAQSAAYHDVARRLHLSDSAFGILYDLAIAPEEGLSQASMCATNGLSKQTVNSSVGRLKEEGLVQTRQMGRKSLVSLTPAGRALADEKIGPVFQAERVALSALTPKERATFVRLVLKYNDALAAAFKEL